MVPTISIVIPAYNEACTGSLLQTGFVSNYRTLDIDYELILVDDGSQDETFSVIQKLHSEDNRIKDCGFPEFRSSNALLAD